MRGNARIMVTKKNENLRQVGKQSKEVAQKTKKKIMMAALKVFAREGYPDASMRAIADEAGTTHSLISHHFGSKEQLWKTLVDFGLEKRTLQLKQIIDSGKYQSPVELFKETITSHIMFFAKHSELAKILLHANGRTGPHFTYILERQKELHSVLAPIFEDVQECGFCTEFDFNNFTLSMRAIAETPVATYELSNNLLGYDIRSQQGIDLHAKRVIFFLFHD